MLRLEGFEFEFKLKKMENALSYWTCVYTNTTKDKVLLFMRCLSRIPELRPGMLPDYYVLKPVKEKNFSEFFWNIKEVKPTKPGYRCIEAVDLTKWRDDDEFWEKLARKHVNAFRLAREYGKELDR